ncbi:uncharacterized protein LOC111708243 isoform X3 [Eurytemora carolleeae]|uniref:uncharacterized protein LOC111708243 isoform X3 n=1 Tax=Eurytemora carolleeae TaxID=1294199 RepID=UPI000C78861D|nr:uncharacterized protein LOC111708243 isoform X3 [Eurytemora carolleeae]|eukprot:XP_023337330.1 uncharacterized protein LOC111708243 isoform X3 [Eurytemora affinis]
MNYISPNNSDPMDLEKNGVKYEILEYMNEKIDSPLDDLMYDLVDELLDESKDDSEYGSSDERMENTDFYLTELTQTEETQCPDQGYFYATVILSGLLGLAILLLILLIIYHWRIRRQIPGGKNVSRAESWRYESNIYIEKFICSARPKAVGGVPVYEAPPLAPPLQRSIPHTTIMENDEDETAIFIS